MSDKQTLFLALDCGGTKCRARLTDMDGTTLGEGLAGPANAFIGLDAVFKEIIKATNQATQAASLSDISLSTIYVGLGMAGLSSGRLREELAHYPHPFARIRAETDGHTAQLGAFNGGDGAILISGTGSCGYAIVGGQIIVKGGSGFNVSDHGSGAHLGRNALRRALQGFEGILPYTSMCQAIMAEFENSVDKLVDWADQAKPVDFGKFSPIVFAHAHEDGLADELIRQSAREIDLMIKALVREGAPSVALVGGMAAPLTSWLSDEARSHLTERLGDALDGARLLALEAYAEIGDNDA